MSFVVVAREGCVFQQSLEWQQAWDQGCFDPLCSLLASMKAVLVAGHASTGCRRSILCSSRRTWCMASCQSIVPSLPV